MFDVNAIVKELKEEGFLLFVCRNEAEYDALNSAYMIVYPESSLVKYRANETFRISRADTYRSEYRNAYSGIKDPQKAAKRYSGFLLNRADPLEKIRYISDFDYLEPINRNEWESTLFN